MNKLSDKLWTLTLPGEVEQKGEVLSVGHPGALYPEFIEEGVAHSFHRVQSSFRCVFEQLGNQVYRLSRCSGPENLKQRIQKEQKKARVLSMSMVLKIFTGHERAVYVLWRRGEA